MRQMFSEPKMIATKDLKVRAYNISMNRFLQKLHFIDLRSVANGRINESLGKMSVCSVIFSLVRICYFK